MNAFWLILLAGVVFAWLSFALERKAMRLYWSRVCTGLRWRRRFPDATKAEFRGFLDVFVDSFGFNEKRRFCFAPDDKVMEVYRALNPIESWPDAMELEELTLRLEERYGVDFMAIWKEGVTLGDLFVHARAASSSSSV